MAYDAFEAPETAIEREERAKAQRRIEKDKQREENRKAHWESKEKAKESKTLAGNVDGDAKECLQEAIADAIRDVLAGSDLEAEAISDSDLITALRIGAKKLLKLNSLSLMLLDGKAQFETIEKMLMLALLLEGRATHITEDKTQMSKEEREASAKRFAELLAKAGE